MTGNQNLGLLNIPGYWSTLGWMPQTLKDQTKESPGVVFHQLELFIYLFIEHLTPTMILKVRRCQFPCDSVRSLKSIPAIGQESQFVGVRTLSWNRFWSLCDLLRFIHRLRNLSQSMFPSWKISLEIQRDGRSYGLRFYFALYEFQCSII